MSRRPASDASMQAMKVQTSVKRNAEEMNAFLTDMASWEKNIKKRDEQLRKNSTTGKQRAAPPVRGGGSIPVGPTAQLAPASRPTTKAEWGGSGDVDAVVPAPRSSENVTVKGKKSRKRNAGVAGTTADKHTYDKGYKSWENFDAEAAEAAVSDDDTDDESDCDGNETRGSDIAVRTPASIVTEVAGGTAAIETPDRVVRRPRPALKTAAEREAEEREKGNSYFKEGKYTKAAKCYTACLGISNRSVAAFSNRAMCWVKLKEWKKAELDCSLALQVDDAHVKSYQRRAAARNALGMHRAALADLYEGSARDEAGTFAKPLAIEIRKTKELLRSAMRNASKVRIAVAVESAVPARPPPTETEPSAMPHTDEAADADTVAALPKYPPAQETEQAANTKVIESIAAPRARQPAVVKMQMTENVADDKDSSESEQDATTGGSVSGASSMLTPANMMNYTYDPSVDSKREDAIKGSEIDERSESAAAIAAAGLECENSVEKKDTDIRSHKGGQNVTEGLRRQEKTAVKKQTSISANAEVASATVSTAKLPKVKDPKGAFELERMWRACNGDATQKRKLAKKLLRPDGKVAKALFGPKASSTVDAEILCDLLCCRILAGISAKASDKVDKNGLSPAEALQKALEAITSAPRFRSSAMFLSSEQQSRVLSLLAEKAPELQKLPVGEAFLSAIA